jgi:hypothetical protein
LLQLLLVVIRLGTYQPWLSREATLEEGSASVSGLSAENGASFGMRKVDQEFRKT